MIGLPFGPGGRFTILLPMKAHRRIAIRPKVIKQITKCPVETMMSFSETKGPKIQWTAENRKRVQERVNEFKVRRRHVKWLVLSRTP